MVVIRVDMTGVTSELGTREHEFKLKASSLWYEMSMEKHGNNLNKRSLLFSGLETYYS